MKYWKISSQFPSPSQDNFYQCHRCSRLIDSIGHSISYIDRNWAEMEKYNDIQRNGLPIEFIFDRNFSDDKEQMANRISRDFLLNAVPSMGMDSGNRQAERVRIGKRIKELREAKKMEARDLALLTGIDAANLSRIEQGKYSTGVDILSRICVILDAHLDLIPNSKK